MATQTINYKGYTLNLKGSYPNYNIEISLFKKLIDNLILVQESDIGSGSGSGSGTENTIIKFSDNDGHLSDSNIHNVGTNVGVNKVDPRESLDVTGNVIISGGLYLSGDANTLDAIKASVDTGILSFKKRISLIGTEGEQWRTLINWE